MGEPLARQPHAALDPVGRLPKAEKISMLLDMARHRSARLLEIGTGSGAIAQYFATRTEFACDVDAVDVVDQRQVHDGYRFQTVDGVQLPFNDNTFDIVISNHVIEHVGNRVDQQEHLNEIARVLRSNGRAYLASPNRWQVVEPHFHLAFLSWLPQTWRTPYLRWRRRGQIYDCEPLQMATLEDLLERSGLEFRNACVAAIRCMIAAESNPSLGLRAASNLPDSTLSLLRRVCPTHIYLLQARNQGG